jgi:lysyl-tRNA synthetase class 2
MSSSASLSLNPTTKAQVIKARAQAMASARAYLDSHGVIEVDTPILYKYPNLDTHIIPFQFLDGKDHRYLHTSPEFGIKRLLAQGVGDVYYLGHVFRSGEVSPKHNPEFTMIEWYRVGMSWETLAAETVNLIEHLLGPSRPSNRFRCRSYRDLFLQFLAIDPFTATIEQLYHSCMEHGIIPYAGIEVIDRDEILNLLLGTQIEPNLGFDGCIDLICDYPPTQAALSQVEKKGGIEVALRFECYLQGIELANGYQELTDPVEQHRRFLQGQRLQLTPLPIDPRFLEALPDVPSCAGVAVGFDRILMLSWNKTEIGQVLSWSWEET